MSDSYGSYIILAILLLVFFGVLIYVDAFKQDFGPVCVTTVSGSKLHGHISEWNDDEGKLTVRVEVGDEEVMSHTLSWGQVESIDVLSEEEFVRRSRGLMQVERAE